MMTLRRRWLIVCLSIPLFILVTLFGWLWLQQKEPTLDGKPLSNHLLKLHDSHADVRASALKYVQAHQEVFGPYCLRLVSNQNTTMQAWMHRFQQKVAPTRLGQKLGVRNPMYQLKVRAMAALALGVVDLPAAEKISALKVGLYDADRQTRMESVKSLAALGAPSLEVLEASMTDVSIGVRNAGLYGMYLLGPEARPALGSLKDLLINEDLNLDPLSFEIFWRIGPEAADTLGSALNTTNAVAKYRLLKAMIPLRRLIYPYRDQFIEGLKHTAPKVRSESARALISAGRVDAKVAALLFPLLRDDAVEVRLTAVQLLNQRVPFAEPAMPELLLLLEDEEKEIRRIAGFMLERMILKTSASRQALESALNSENIYVREVAGKALANQ